MWSPAAATRPSAVAPTPHLPAHADNRAYRIRVGLVPHEPVGTLAVQLHLSYRAEARKVAAHLDVCRQGGGGARAGWELGVAVGGWKTRDGVGCKVQGAQRR